MINDAQVGAFMEHRGKIIANGWQNCSGTSIEKRYNETRGFWMIPPTQIVLSEGVLEQTPGWTADFDHVWSKERLPY